MRKDIKELLATCDVRLLIPERNRHSYTTYTSDRCPFHDDTRNSLLIYQDGFNCQACGARGSAIDFVMRYYDLPFTRAVDFLEKGPKVEPRENVVIEKEPEKPKELNWRIAAKHHTALNNYAMAYYRARGLKDETIKHFMLGWHKEKKRFVIPVSQNGKLLALRYRKDDLNKDDTGDKFSAERGYNSTLLFNSDSLKDKDTAIICEGEFDAILLWQELNGEYGVVTSTNGSSAFKKSWCKEYFNDIVYPFICMDSDKSGQDGAMRIWKMLRRSRIIKLPEMGDGKKDITDYFLSGYSVDDFKELMAQAINPWCKKK